MKKKIDISSHARVLSVARHSLVTLLHLEVEYMRQALILLFRMSISLEILLRVKVERSMVHKYQ